MRGVRRQKLGVPFVKRSYTPGWITCADLNMMGMTQRMSDMLQLVVTRGWTQHDGNGASSLPIADFGLSIGIISTVQ